MTLRNTIVADNSATVVANQIGGKPITSNGYNLVEGGCSGCVASDRTADPMLGPLANNGGDTFTQALLAGSPAIDAALPSDAPATDQRGVARPLGATADIGAYEYDPPLVAVSVTPDGGQSLSHLPSNGTPYSATFTVTNTGNGASTYGLKALGGAAGAVSIVSVDGVAGDTANVSVAAGASRSVVVEYVVGGRRVGHARHGVAARHDWRRR